MAAGLLNSLKCSLTEFSVLCSLNVSSSTIVCSLHSRSFLLPSPSPPLTSPPQLLPPPSSLPCEHDVLLPSCSWSPSSSLFPVLMLNTALFGDDTS
ncbi:hypothetical protein CRG98_000702 [Punica granatum]|uniref:Uncharacterized protein n=1 Tax=Punica granatum TaxID=22663 RepID=A0A2I0LE01_PUNGR|nr:hypothetical protein CRG98_000702 [Punica granatum]